MEYAKSSTTRVLVVDDSPLIRAMLRDILTAAGDIVVTGEAKNGSEGVTFTELLRPDLVIMDIQMPVMDGLTAIEEIMERVPTPILVLTTSLQDRELDLAFAALRRGALDVLQKPAAAVTGTVPPFAELLRGKVRLLARVRVIRHTRRNSRPHNGLLPGLPAGRSRRILAIGASTGGPRAVMSIVKSLPADFAGGVCIVQHMTNGFTGGFAEWLNRESPLRVRLAREGDRLLPGEVLVAPDGLHMAVEQGRVILCPDPPVNSCRPSIDVLFNSLAADCGEGAVGVLLTGMGKDGAAGLQSIRKSGGATIVQDEESSAVFGMPKAAIALDAAEQVLSLDAIPGAIAALFTATNR